VWPPSALESLRAQVRRIEGQHRRGTPSLPFGVGAVDARIPGGALPLGALHEIAGGGNGAIDGAAAALFAAGIAARAAKCSGVSRDWTYLRRRSRKPG
jgi:protein ImuA